MDAQVSVLDSDQHLAWSGLFMAGPGRGVDVLGSVLSCGVLDSSFSK